MTRVARLARHPWSIARAFALSGALMGITALFGTACTPGDTTADAGPIPTLHVDVAWTQLSTSALGVAVAARATGGMPPASIVFVPGDGKPARPLDGPIEHLYPGPGLYEAAVTATDGERTTTLHIDVVVKDGPEVDCDCDTPCTGGDVCLESGRCAQTDSSAPLDVDLTALEVDAFTPRACTVADDGADDGAGDSTP